MRGHHCNLAIQYNLCNLQGHNKTKERREIGAAISFSQFTSFYFCLNLTDFQSIMVVYNWSPPYSIACNKNSSGEIRLSKFRYVLPINKINDLFDSQIKCSSYSCQILQEFFSSWFVTINDISHSFYKNCRNFQKVSNISNSCSLEKK